MLTIAKQDRYDLLNTPGDDKPSYTLWFSGCTMNCDECHNPLLQEKSYGLEYNENTVLYTICHECEKQDINTVVLLGGEPMEQDIESLTYLLSKLYTYGYKIWLYTGWEYEDIPNSIKQYLYTIKCGRYNKDLHVDGFPSSSNQRVFRNINHNWEQITL